MPRRSGLAEWWHVHRAAVFAVVVILAHLPLFLLHLRSLWLFRSHYYFYPLLLAGIACLFWKRRPQFSRRTLPPRWSSVLLGCGLLTLSAGVLFFSPWLGAVATVLSAGGLIGRYAVPGQGRDWLPVWLLTWLIVPPPFRWDFHLVAWLQSSSVQMASMLVEVVGVRHLREGNVLVLPDHRMLANEAWSGIHSLPVLLTVAALFAVAFRRPLLWAVLLLSSSVAWAWLANVARIAASVLAQAWYQVDLTSGQSYELLGYAATLLALALLASTDRGLAFLLRPIIAREGDLPLQVTSTQNRLNRTWNWLVSARQQTRSDSQTPSRQETHSGRRKGRKRGERESHSKLDARPPRNPGRLRDAGWLGAFGLLGALQIACFVVPAVATDIHGATVPRWDMSMPESLGGWTLVKRDQVERGHNDPAGRFSCQWTYRRESLVCRISFDYPVADWHEPTNGYAANGWQRIGRRVVSGAGEDRREGPLVEVELSKPNGEYGWLLFGLLDPAGNSLSPSTDGWSSMADRLARRPVASRLRGRGAGSLSETAYSVQAFVSSMVRLSAEQRVEVGNLFAAARSQVVTEHFRKATEEERKP
jgi:exosortase